MGKESEIEGRFLRNIDAMPVLRHGFDHTTYRAAERALTLYPTLTFEDLTRYAAMRNTANASLTQPFAIGNHTFIGKVMPIERYGMMPSTKGTVPYTVAKDTKLVDVNTYLSNQNMHVQETLNRALETIENKLEKESSIRLPQLFWYAVGVHESPVGTTLVVHELADNIAEFIRRNTPLMPHETAPRISPIARPAYRNTPIATSLQRLA